MTLSQGMTYVLAAALVALAIRGAVAPRAAAASYGIPIPDGVPPTPYLEVKVNRDFVLAGLLVVVAASAGSSVLSAGLFVGIIAPLADAFEVGRHGKASGTGIHLATAAYMGVAAFLALSGR
jgi:hypothetical protein